MQVSVAVRRFSSGWMGLKKKRWNGVSRINFSLDATPKERFSIVRWEETKVFLVGVSHVGLSIYSDFGKVVITRI